MAILRLTVEKFLAHAGVDVVQVVIHKDDRKLYDAALGVTAPGLLEPVTGGETRQASVHLGLEALRQEAPDLVLIHDAARPFVSAEEIGNSIAVAAEHGGAIVALALADTLKRAGEDHLIAQTIPRAGLWRALTPQTFHFDAILQAHRTAAEAGRSDFTDDAAVAEAAGLAVALVPGSPDNFKITTVEDLAMAETRLGPPTGFDVRTGTGFDVHRLVPGDHVWLCGIKIAHDKTLHGHSDADVGLHALTDAILGAIGDGDIGAHFPPSDPQWKGAASDQFLADAARRVRERGGRISNVDVTLLCEAPKVGPHREDMRVRIGDILQIDVARVGVKATTTERLGFTGREEGIAAMASATVILGG